MINNSNYQQHKFKEIIALFLIFLIIILLFSSHIIIYNAIHMQSEVPDIDSFFRYGYKQYHESLTRNRPYYRIIMNITFFLSYTNIYDIIAVISLIPGLYILKHRSLKLESALTIGALGTGSLLAFQPSLFVESRILDLTLRQECYMWIRFNILIAFILILILWLYMRIFFKYSSNGITLLSNTQIILLGIPFVIIFSLFVSLIPILI